MLKGFNPASLISVPISAQRGKKPNVFSRGFIKGKQI
jgi:hypothetical protein